MSRLRRIATLLLLQQCRAYNPAAGAASVRRAADLARVAAPRAAVSSEEKTGAAAKIIAPVAVRREGKLYTTREAPKFAGGVKVGARRVVVITGASSGLGLSATIALLAAAQKKNYFVVAAARQHGQGAPLAGPQRAPLRLSGRAWWLWAASSPGEGRAGPPPGAQRLPRCGCSSSSTRTAADATACSPPPPIPPFLASHHHRPRRPRRRRALHRLWSPPLRTAFGPLRQVRDPERMENVALENGISRNDYVALKLELASLQVSPYPCFYPYP